MPAEALVMRSDCARSGAHRAVTAPSVAAKNEEWVCGNDQKGALLAELFGEFRNPGGVYSQAVRHLPQAAGTETRS